MQELVYKLCYIADYWGTMKLSWSNKYRSVVKLAYKFSRCLNGIWGKILHANRNSIWLLYVSGRIFFYAPFLSLADCLIGAYVLFSAGIVMRIVSQGRPSVWIFTSSDRQLSPWASYRHLCLWSSRPFSLLFCCRLYYTPLEDATAVA